MRNLFAFRALMCAFVATSLVMPLPAVGEPTDLDPSFGVAGIARLSSDLWLQRAAAYSDGRLALLIVDRAAPYAQSVVRLDASGRIDASFAPVKALPEYRIDSIAVAPAGRLATFQAFLRTPNGETRVALHLDDGTLDPGFGESGTALVSRFPYRSDAHIGEFGEFSSDLAIDPSGRLYMSTVLDHPIHEAWITLVGAAGSPIEQLNRTNPSFTGWSGYGRLRAEAGGRIVALLPTYERLLFGGPKVGGPALVRLIDGALDPLFGSGGIAFHPLPNWISYSDDGKYDFASTADGGYVVAGVAQDPQGQDQIVVVKFAGTGAVDAAFGESGVAFLQLARPGDFVSNVKLAIQPDGRVVIASTIQQLVSFRIGLGRLTTAGKPDAQFAAAGVASFWVEGGASAEFIFVRPDGRIVVAGAYGSPAGQPAVLQFLGGNSTRIRPLRELLAIEYFHAGQGHYFLTAEPHEIAYLDTLNPNGWERTGYSFRVWDDDDPSLSPTCRFWSDQSFAPKSSHFYTPYETECSLLKTGSTWRFEGNSFDLLMPMGVAGSRVCPINSQPLYRAYNNSQGGAPNHRYTTNPSVLDEMVAKGWMMEGEAQTKVFACVPIQE